MTVQKGFIRPNPSKYSVMMSFIQFLCKAKRYRKRNKGQGETQLLLLFYTQSAMCRTSFCIFCFSNHNSKTVTLSPTQENSLDM